MNFLLATDLDRTLLPNGKEPDEEGSLEKLLSILAVKNMALTYVTGRNLRLVKEAMSEFTLATPDYLISEVGTMVYIWDQNEFKLHPEWLGYLKAKALTWERDKLEKIILTNLSGQGVLQEGEFQNDYKISFYINESDFEICKTKLAELSILTDMDAELIFSFDPLKQAGLLDVLPRVATKVTALEFLRSDLGLSLNEVVYCGDSGNDVLPLSFGYKAIVVNNAHLDTKKIVKDIVQEKQISDQVYFASGASYGNGNYSSGILEGLNYFGLI